MSDENELNSKLGDEHIAIESALRGVSLPQSAIDHDSVMYQAGWAAALAEWDSHSPSASKTNSRFWPALAAAFATTTAACLFVILTSPVIDGSSGAVATTDEVSRQSIAENTGDEDVPSLDEIPLVDAAGPEVSRDPSQLKVHAMFGNTLNRIFKARNAQVQRFAVEAASPLRSISMDNRIDWELEPPVPLTPGSIRSSL